jgi:hypothetical protein
VAQQTCKKRIYLDVCTLCRPYDDQSRLRIRLETEALYLILQYIQNNQYTMMVSPVHFKEVEAIQDMIERVEVTAILHKYGSHPLCDLNEVCKRAESLYAQRLGIADAAHVAFAEASSDVFITCDGKLLKKCRKITVKVETMNPVEFCASEDLL